jgi:hypothetical protein
MSERAPDITVEADGRAELESTTVLLEQYPSLSGGPRRRGFKFAGPALRRGPRVAESEDSPGAGPLAGLQRTM